MTVRVASVALVLVTALVQVAIGYRLQVAGASPDVLVLVVASIALLTGPVPGAACGFLAGVALATFAAIPLGPHALLATLVGYAIGRVGEALVTDDHPVPPLVAGIFATLTMQLGRPLIEFLVNPDINTIDTVVSRAVVVTIISAVLAVPTYLVVRRALRLARAFDVAGGEVAA